MNKIKVEWSSNFAYAVGLLTTDGNLSPDGRHISFTSKDRQLVEKFKNCLLLSNKIGRKGSGRDEEKKYYVIQFGNVVLYSFLLGIGIMPHKSKILGNIDIPEKYFWDFLRGHFDGDGTFYSYWDPRWRSSFMFYITFVSASKRHIEWLRKEISRRIEIKGHVTKAEKSSVYQLKYAKRESLKLIPKLYYDKRVPCLLRKRSKIESVLRVQGIK